MVLFAKGIGSVVVMMAMMRHGVFVHQNFVEDENGEELPQLWWDNPKSVEMAFVCESYW